MLVGVLEHVRDLGSALAALRTVLVDGGLLYVEVPDATRFADHCNAPFQDFSTEHINFFSPPSLDQVMQSHGFSRVFSEQNSRQQNYRTSMSNISALFRKIESDPFTFCKDAATEQGLRKYISQSRNAEEQVRLAIEQIVAQREPMIVWGVGTHTLHMLEAGLLPLSNIVAFVDSNPKYQGALVKDIEVLAPADLKTRREPILISSRVFQQEIETQIRGELGLTNEVIKLYDL